MNNEAVCGYVQLLVRHRIMDNDEINIYIFKKIGSADKGVVDYCNELNALHEAEGLLTYLQRRVYLDHLAKIVDVYDDYYEGITFSEAGKLALATARQKSVALMKALIR